MRRAEGLEGRAAIGEVDYGRAGREPRTEPSPQDNTTTINPLLLW